MLTCLRREKAFLSRTKGKEGTPLSEGLQVAPTHAWAAELGEAVCMRGLLLHTWEQLPEKATKCFSVSLANLRVREGPSRRGGRRDQLPHSAGRAVSLPGITCFPTAPGLGEGSLRAGEASV